MIDNSHCASGANTVVDICTYDIVSCASCSGRSDGDTYRNWLVFDQLEAHVNGFTLLHWPHWKQFVTHYFRPSCQRNLTGTLSCARLLSGRLVGTRRTPRDSTCES